ncbi:MAG: hypothetical protein ACYDAG_02465 [Chloroflexota bacterium]
MSTNKAPNASRVYDLTVLPGSIAARTSENAQDQSVLKWSGAFPIPSLGQRIIVKLNALGHGTVRGYFHEHGYVGVAVELDRPPEWYIKQNGPQYQALVFGAEIKEV